MGFLGGLSSLAKLGKIIKNNKVATAFAVFNVGSEFFIDHESPQEMGRSIGIAALSSLVSWRLPQKGFWKPLGSGIAADVGVNALFRADQVPSAIVSGIQMNNLALQSLQTPYSNSEVANSLANRAMQYAQSSFGGAYSSGFGNEASIYASQYLRR
jgi:hypothetical protein